MPSVSDKIMKALISNRVVGFRYELLDKGDHVIKESLIDMLKSAI